MEHTFFSLTKESGGKTSITKLYTCIHVCLLCQIRSSWNII